MEKITKSTTKTTMSKSLSLVQRESFFDDAFFKDSWGDFDTAIQSILDKFDTTGTKLTTSNRNNCTDIYRKIRTTNIDKDLYQSQALQVTEKDGKFQCVMDVKDFNPNDLQVKVVEDRVVIEGKFEKKSEDGTSMSSKSFYKEFTLPKSADLESVSTALSRDGVLTVKAPKREGADAAPSGALQSSQTSSTVQESSSTSKNVQDGSSSVAQQSSSTKSFSSTSSSTFSSTKKVSSSVSSTSSVASSNLSELADSAARDIQDRLVFTHDSVNVKLPGK